MKTGITFIIYFFSLLFIFTGCSDKFTPQLLEIPFDSTAVAPPDYSMNENWASLPAQKDNADNVPSCCGFADEQDTSSIDVFFIHPTTYLSTTNESTQWNASVHDQKINDRTDATTILYQASVFNGAGKIYAPRYRQAHLSAFFTSLEKDAHQALDLAYNDVKKSFEYYLTYYNHGRPVIIASHSQGTKHAIRLLKDFFEGKPLMKQLVAAYLIGMPVRDTMFTILKPCRSEGETGCYVSWRTYARNFFPPGYVKPAVEAVCTNPLTWTTDSSYASCELNKGGILKNFNRPQKFQPHDSRVVGCTGA
ncbi:MAG: DUF3089 domain-containing protein [Bacteroidetes bacterium]|nr:DUF3089 domain-containing protein [Bacteroidota bacterium]